jgi:broad specificity phosphatase PhoE
MRARQFTFVRHASTVYNGLRLLNGDARIPVPLDAAGRVAATRLAVSLAGCPFDLAVRTSFARTRETMGLLLAHRPGVPVAVEPAFDDIRVGMFEGRDIKEYRAWRAHHPPSERVPGGESRVEALERYSVGISHLLGRFDARCVLLVVHDMPMRFLRNALLGVDPLDGPVRTIANLEVVRVGEDRLGAALAVMRRRVAGLSAV